jgi:hypothetical protein
VYYDSTANVLYYYNGSGWINTGGMTAGLLSARPSAGSGNVGTFYYATDNKLMYYSNGSTWAQSQQFGAVANLGSSGSNGTSTDYARADHVHRHSNADHSGINISALASPVSDVDFGNNKITNLKTPTADGDAANKYYVDNAIAGLDWKEAVHLLSTTNVALTGTSGTLVIDGHAALDNTDAGYRLLLIGQSTSANNGIYVYADNGTTYTLTRASDADVYTELLGASVFVSEGTAYGKTSWIQSNHYLTSFSGQDWVQFSGSGTYVAGAGLALDGNIFNVGTVSTARIVVNADNIDLATVAQTNSTASDQTAFINAVSVDSYGRVTGVSTAAHAVAGTAAAGIASFADANFTVGTTGAVTAKGITLTAGTGITLSTTSVNLGGVLTVTNAGVTSLTAGTGVSVSAGTGGVTLTNTGILSVAGTANQVVATTTAGAVTLSLPQSIAATSTPTFGGLTVNGTVSATTVTATTVSGTTATFTGTGTVNNLIVSANTGYLYANATGTATASTTIPGSAISGNITGNSANVTGIVAVANGGTGATTAASARTALGATTKLTGTLNFSATTVASINHGLGQWVTAQAFDGSGYLIETDVQNTSTGSGTTIYTVSATSATATNFTYVIVG